MDELERQGVLASPVAVEDAPDAAETEGEAAADSGEKPAAVAARPMTPDEIRFSGGPDHVEPRGFAAYGLEGTP